MPSRAEKGKLRALNFRTTFEIYASVQREAEKSGRSVAQELEDLIADGLRSRETKGAWGWDIFPVFNSLALALWHIESLTHKRWWEDERTFDLFKRTMAKLTENYRRIISQDLLEFKPSSHRLSLDQSPDDLAEAVAAAVGIGAPTGIKEDKAKHRARIAAALREAHARMDAFNSRPLAIEDET